MKFKATLRWLERAYHHKGTPMMGWTFIHLTPSELTEEGAFATCFFEDHLGQRWKTTVTLDSNGIHWNVITSVFGEQVEMEEADEVENAFFQLTLENYRALVESARKWKTLLEIKDRLDAHKDSLPPTPRL